MIEKQDDYLIGYLAYYLSPQKAYYGGLLVTNTRGVPREFRHSEAVKPSRLQSTLYGDSLESSLGADALGPALYDALGAKPDVLLLDQAGQSLFGHFVRCRAPAALLVRLADADMAFAAQLEPEGDLIDAKEYELKGSSSERVYAYIEENRERPIGARILDLAQKRMNLLSPFDRIRTALSEISQVEPTRMRS
jgi:hypothetical protein